MDDDPEMGLNGTTDKLAQAEMAAAQPAPNMEEAKNFKLVQSSMNYTTVDHGDRCKSSASEEFRCVSQCKRGKIN